MVGISYLPSSEIFVTGGKPTGPGQMPLGSDYRGLDSTPMVAWVQHVERHKPCGVGLCRGTGVEYLSLARNADVEATLGKALAVTCSGNPVVVEVAIDYSEKTYFTRRRTHQPGTFALA